MNTAAAAASAGGPAGAAWPAPTIGARGRAPAGRGSSPPRAAGGCRARSPRCVGSRAAARPRAAAARAARRRRTPRRRRRWRWPPLDALRVGVVVLGTLRRGAAGQPGRAPARAAAGRPAAPTSRCATSPARSAATASRGVVDVDGGDSRLRPRGPLALHAVVTPLPAPRRRAGRGAGRGPHRRPPASRTVRRDFVANVSHELKTPVGALSLLAEALLDAPDDPVAVRRFAGRMQHESGRLARLVQELIDLSRLQGADPPREPDPGRPRPLRGARPWTAPGCPPSAGRIEVVSGGNRGDARCAATRPSSSPRWSTWSTTRSTTARDHTRVAIGVRRHDGDVEISRERPGHRDRRAGPRAGLRAVLPGRPGPLAGHRRHRPRAGHRQAHRHQPRRRRHACGASRAPAPPSPCGCRADTVPTRPRRTLT